MQHTCNTLPTQTEELDVARQQVDHVKSALARMTKETKETKEKSDHSSRSRRAKGGEESLSMAVSSLQSGEEARKRCYALEQQVANMQRVVEVEKEGELRTLRAERDAMNDRNSTTERQLQQARRRVRTLEQGLGEGKSNQGNGGGAMYLRSSEDRFREQEQVRGELDQMTAERNLLEGRLLERDNLIMVSSGHDG
jgi:hypothetical protein